MASANKKSQVIVDLNKILNLIDATEIKRMKVEFETHGWCFVNLPTELIPQANLTDELSKFFKSDKNKNYYSQKSAIYGYSAVNHKEGIKLLTGGYYSELAHLGLVPRTLVKPLNYLSQALDAATKRLIEVLDYHCVFQQQPSLSSLVKNGDLPLQNWYFGMLDIVSYFNNKSGFQPPHIGKTTDEVNCVSHYDPGLLSISILSTHEGLQLKNMTNDEWVDGPLEPNIGVIWLGEAAARVSQNRLKPGIHRVVYPQKSKQRLTIWYEICTTEQLKKLSGDKKNERMPVWPVRFKNLPDLPPVAVLPGENKLDFLKRIETGYGLSISKTGEVFYDIEKHDISYPHN